ncbi:gp53-like domain-containing protein [Photorhabdus khanii]|uniref:gp53-like domain-containing protein n=1 Tax=Photorhabdus khanii TaxID=1004150 RepID=UPI003BB66F35
MGECDGRFQLKGNYTPAGQSYTKSESDARYGSKNTANKTANGWWRCEDTGMIYQWGVTRVLEPQEIITVQLPVRFSNVCVSVMLTVNRLGSGSGIANGYVADLSPSSFKLTNDYAVSDISVGYYWFAVGY